MRPPKQVSEESLHAAWMHLSHKDLDLLGDWRFDKDFLRELSGKLVGKQLGIIDSFFAPALAEMLHNESVQHLAWGRKVGDPLETTPLGQQGGLKEYNAQSNPNERCVFVAGALTAPGREKFFSYNIIEDRELELPGRMAVQELFRQREWIKGWTILLTGTDEGIDELFMTEVLFREYRPGDYINLHTDQNIYPGEYNERRLCFSYWTPSPDWDPEWGGSFVWCGKGVRNPQGTGGHFPNSFRAPTRYNQAGFFVPSDESWHIVDRVSEAVGPSRHRFSFTSWLEERMPQSGLAEL